MLVRHGVRRRDVARSSAVEASSPADVSSPVAVSVSSPASSPTSPAIRAIASPDTVTSATRLDSRASSARDHCPPHTRRIPPIHSPPAIGPRTGSGKSESAAQRRLPGGQTTHQPTTCICPAVSPTPTHARLSRSQPACQPHAAIHQSYLCFARPSAPRCYPSGIRLFRPAVCPTLRGTDCQRQCSRVPLVSNRARPRRARRLSKLPEELLRRTP